MTHIGTRRAVRVVGVLGVGLAVCLSGCGPSPAPDPSSSKLPTLTTALATSLPTTEGTWATVPMGLPEQPLNTFWQLLFEPAGSAVWSNHAQATAVATNGGIVLASSPDGAVVAGVRPSDLLRYSPLILSSDAGSTWSNGVLADGLAAEPDALALGPSGRALALVDRRGVPQVVRGEAGLGSWTPAADVKTLAAAAGGCRLGTLTSVSFLGAEPVVGGDCRHGATVGLLVETRSGGWHLTGPTLPVRRHVDRVDVEMLHSTGEGLEALLALHGKQGTSLVATWTNGVGRWTVSPALAMARSETSMSVGPGSGREVFALLTSSSGARRLEWADPTGGWSTAPAPPSRTQTVAVNGDGVVSALEVEGPVLEVWVLDAARGTWARSQTLPVAIQYGSSS